MSSLYIHIPFCLAKCEYCAFNSYAGLEGLYPRYVKAVKKEIIEHFFAGKPRHLDTIFFGGGTPSVLPADSIDQILTCCQEYLGIADNAEITLEANPKTIDFMKLLQLRQAGVNRISIGIQSFIDEELNILGRLHTAQDGWDCIRDAIGAGFANINVDLIYGIPGQSVEKWQWNLETALSLGVSHLSLYQLTVEENTPLEAMVRQGVYELADEEIIEQMDSASVEFCKEQGFGQYEISNYAQDGYQCRHNLNYWHNLDYLAVGAGGVGYIGGERSKNIGDPLLYCEAVENGKEVVIESERLSREASFRESVIFGMRLLEGVSYGNLYDRYGIHLRDYYGEILEPLINDGFVEFTSTHFRLTEKGRKVANQIFTKLV